VANDGDACAARDRHFPANELGRLVDSGIGPGQLGAVARVPLRVSDFIGRMGELAATL